MILICVDKCFVFCVMSSVFQKLIPLALEPVLHGEISSLREVVPVLQAGEKKCPTWLLQLPTTCPPRDLQFKRFGNCHLVLNSDENSMMAQIITKVSSLPFGRHSPVTIFSQPDKTGRRFMHRVCGCCFVDVG